jgi:hypothetical protein
LGRDCGLRGRRTRSDDRTEQRIQREGRSREVALVDSELRRRDVAIFLDRRFGYPLKLRQGPLQRDEIALGSRSEEEAVRRRSLAIGDVEGVRRRQKDASEHLELVDRHSSVDLSVRREIEEVEPALFGRGIVGILVEYRVVDTRFDGGVRRSAT